MELPIDTTTMSFICAAEPAEVLDFETRRPKTDVNGVPLYSVRLLVMADGRAEVIGLKLPGRPTGITQGLPVRPTSLVAIPWAKGDRAGVGYRAATLEPLTTVPATEVRGKGGAA